MAAVSSSFVLPRRRASTRVTRAPARLLDVDGGSERASTRAKSSRKTRKTKREWLQVAPALFPAIDDTTAAIITSYMPSRDLGASALVSKAWLGVNSNESLWRPFLASVDPMSALGEDRVNKLAAHFSCKQVVSELSSRLCSLCQEPTNRFFVLTCSRVCLSCFETDERVKMCSLSYAKIHYLLSKSQVEKLPTIYADPTNETGKIITICSAAKASAVARWGSDKAFEAEMGARKARGKAAYETLKKANRAQYRLRASPTFTATSTGNQGASGRGEIKRDSEKRPPVARRKVPARSLLLHLDSDVNSVGVGQQQFRSKYGLFTIVNEAFFDSGPTVMITETTSTDGAESTDDEECMGECGGKTYRESRYSRIRQARGSKLIDALRGVKAGTTINVTTSSVLADHLCIRAPVRLLSTEQGEVEIWDGDLVITAPSIIRDLRVNRLPDAGKKYKSMVTHPEIVAPALTIKPGVLIGKCSLGTASPFPQPTTLLLEASSIAKNEEAIRFSPCLVGHAVILQLGRLVTRGNTFSQATSSLSVRPFTDCDHLTTTEHL